MSRPWQIHRRTFLRGLGTAVALPLLEAMAPSLASIAKASDKAGAATAAAATKAPRRMAFIYVPNGKNMADWTPAAVGRDYQLTPILQPLARHRDDFSLITGSALQQANALGDGGGDHARSAASFLTAAHPRKTAGANIRAGVSVDQVAAKAVGDHTRFSSLELSCDKGQTSGTCESGYSCAYQFNLAWKSETMPLTPEVDPKLVFERLFQGGSADEGKEARAKRMRHNASVLDYVMEDAGAMQQRLGATDRRKLDEYLSAVRDIEKRIRKASRFDIDIPMADEFEEPVRIPDDYSYEEHIRLMYDMIALAFQTDSTRITSFIVAHDGSNRPYPNIGVSDGHHDLSHHRNDGEKKAQIAKINTFHTHQFSYFLDKLKSIREGEGTLLDNSMVVYGSAISDGNQHLHEDLPILLAGRGGGTLSPGRHIRVAENTPLANLYVSMLDRIGAPVERFGDSTGPMEVIAG